MIEFHLQEFQPFAKATFFSFFPLKTELVQAEQFPLQCISH